MRKKNTMQLDLHTVDQEDYWPLNNFHEMVELSEFSILSAEKAKDDWQLILSQESLPRDSSDKDEIWVFATNKNGFIQTIYTVSSKDSLGLAPDENLTVNLSLPDQPEPPVDNLYVLVIHNAEEHCDYDPDSHLKAACLTRDESQRIELLEEVNALLPEIAIQREGHRVPVNKNQLTLDFDL